MIKLIFEITETEKGIGVEMKSEACAPSPNEKTFASNFARGISNFLSGAPGVQPKESNDQTTKK